MQGKDLFAALDGVEPAVSVGELHAYMQRKVRQRKWQIRALGVAAVLAFVLAPFVMMHSDVEDKPNNVTALPPIPAPLESALQTEQPHEEQHSAPVRRQPHRTARNDQPVRNTMAAGLLHEESKASVVAVLLTLSAPDRPGSHESIVSNFFANTIQ